MGGKTNAVFQVQITLRKVRPVVWRRVQTPDVTLHLFHEIIQHAMGWSNRHGYKFIVGRQHFAEPRATDGRFVRGSNRVLLSHAAAKATTRFLYLYDFTDFWFHTIEVEEVVPSREGVRYPLCVAGKNACPPDHVGGPVRYARFLEALEDPLHPEHERWTKFQKGPFDPGLFDLDAANERLATIKLP